MLPLRFSLLAAGMLAVSRPVAGAELPLDRISLPQGFAIELVARVPDAREMAFGARGTLFVGSMAAGKVYAVAFRAGGAAEVTTIASGLKRPVGVAFRDQALYVSAPDRILRFDDIESRLHNPPPAALVSDKFPGEALHDWKFIAFGPDGKLYVPVGAPCNICEPDPDRHAVITRMNPDGSAGRCLPAVCAIRLASIGTRGRRSFGSPTTAATGWGTICRRIP
jgi:glucose/arabinose dehydrogenase